MASISTANISQKWADNGYWNAETNNKAIYAGYATSTDINYVTRITILMPGNGVAVQAKIAYRHDGSLNGKQLKYKVVKTEQDATYGRANASTPGDGTLTISASNGYFTINYSGSFSAGEYLYIYLWTGGGTNVYTLCHIQATSNHTITYTEGTSSSLTIAGNTIGSTVGFTVNTDNASFLHSLTVSFGTYTSVVAERSSQKSFSWVPPLPTFAAFIPNGTSITGTVTLSTYNGSAFLGSETYNLQLHLPASVVPTIDASKIDLVPVSDNEKVQSFGVLVQKYSRVKAVIESDAASGVYGSTITSVSLVYAGRQYPNLETGILASPGYYTFSVVVTDSRSRTATANIVEYVHIYSEPYFVSHQVYRCDREGSPDREGSYLFVSIETVWTSIEGRNGHSTYLKLEGRRETPEYFDIVDGAPNVLNLGLSSEQTYNATVVVVDDVGNLNDIKVILPAPTVTDFMIAPGHINQAAFFKKPTREGLDVPAPIYCDQLHVGGVTGPDALKVETGSFGVHVYVDTQDGEREWFNPPMIEGVEYRTTGRCAGKPVYKSVTRIAGLPNGEYTTYNLNATHCDLIVRADISYKRVDDGVTYYNLPAAGNTYLGSYGTAYVVFEGTLSDLTGYEAYVTLEYTKE